MSTSFSSTLRILQNDSQTFSLGWVVMVSVLLLGWLGWFFFASLSRSVEGNIVSADGAGIVLAQFPGEAASQLRIGQSAAILPAVGAQRPQNEIPATVSNIQTEANAPTLVEFYIDLDAPSAVAFHDGISGTASVVVEQISPAMFVWRTSGEDKMTR